MARASTFLGQIILGWYLSPSVFGVYGAAIGVLGLTGSMRAGGVATYLPTMTPDEFRREAGRLFGWGFVCIATGAALTAAAAEPASQWLKQPALPIALYVLAGRHFISIFSLIARMRMTVDHRFKELAVLDSACALVKLVLSISLAMWLWDTEYAVLALAIPFASATVIELAYCVPASGVTMREYTPQLSRLWSTAKQVRWALAVAMLFSINSQANYVVISKMIPVAAVGWIYFAYQLAVQPMMLFNSALTNVFAPIMARNLGNEAQERETIHRVFAGSMLLIPFVVFGTFAVFPAGEELIYQGRWQGAIAPFFFLCVGTCFATVSVLLTGPLLGLRHFAMLAGFEAMRAVGLIGGTAIGFAACIMMGLDLSATLLPDGSPAPDIAKGATIIAAGAGIFMAVVAIWQIVIVMRRFRMPFPEMARTMFLGPVVGVLTMVTAISLGDSVAQSIHPASLHPMGVNVLRVLVTGGAFALITIVCVRFIAETTLRRTIEVMPDRVRERVSRLLRL